MKLAAPVLALTLGLAASVTPAVAGRDALPAGPAPQRAIAIAEDQRRWSDGELKRFLDDDSPAVRARAARAAARLQDSTSVDALALLLDDPEARVRVEAAFALGEVGRRDARPALQASLADPDEAVVCAAIEALGKIGDKAATPTVLQALGLRSPRARAEAAVALWRLADTSAVAALLPHLAEPRPEVRWRVVYALEKLPAPARIVPAVAPLLADPDPLVRAHAARTLGRQKSRLALDPLLAPGARGVADPDPAVRVNALRAVTGAADLNDPRVVAALMHALADPEPSVRATAAQALGDDFAWGAEPASGLAPEQIARGLADRDPAVRGACGRALVAHLGADGLAMARPLLADSSVYARVPVLDGLRVIPDARYASPMGGGAALEALAVRTLLGSLGADHPLLERMTAAEVLGALAGRLRHRPGSGGSFDAATLGALREGVRDTSVLAAASCAGALGDWGDTASVALLAEEYARRGLAADADARQGIRDALRQLAGRAFADSVEHARPVRDEPAAYAPDFEQPPRERRAVIHTSVGDIEWELLGNEAPQTVKNFVRLARSGWFDGGVFHRVVPDFVIQDGDPTGTGSGGPGWTIRCEYNRLRYDAGMVGMALSGKDTGGSQWFVTLAPQPHLDGRYTIFARVTKGMDVAKRCRQGTRIVSVEIPR